MPVRRTSPTCPTSDHAAEDAASSIAGPLGGGGGKKQPIGPSGPTGRLKRTERGTNETEQEMMMTDKPPNRRTELQKTIDGFHALGENWDNYGALPIDRDSIEHAKEIIQGLTDRMLEGLKVLPSPDGRVCFERDTPRRYVEFFVRKDGVLEFIKSEEGVTPLWQAEGLLRWVNDD